MGVKKYEIDTPENREFLKEQSVELLEFGRRFASPGGSAYYLGDDGTPWKDKNRDSDMHGERGLLYRLYDLWL